MITQNSILRILKDNCQKAPIAGKDPLFHLCKHFNPSDNTRPFRCSLEILKHFTKLRTNYTLIYAKYKRSGHHSTDQNQLSVFSSYVHGDSKILYAFEFWQGINIFMLG